MSERAEILKEHLARVPQPLQAVIREHLAQDKLQTGLGDLRARFGLSEEQVESIMTECIMVLCHVTPASELKDSLIAECDLSYEVAVRIQRLFETEVLLPISQEASARGYDEGDEIDSREVERDVPRPAVPLYEDDHLRITPTQLVKGGVTYSTSTIVSVIRPMRLSVFDDFGGFAINAALLVGGVVGILAGISSLNVIFILGGLAAGALGYFNVKGILNSKWWVTVELGTGEKVRIERQKKEDIDAIYSALSEVV